MASDEPEEIACTLAPGEMPDRLEAWRAVVADVVDRRPIDGGLRLILSPTAPVGAIAELAAAEQQCCAFFRFAITVDSRGTALEVTAPDDAAPLLNALFAPA